MRWMVNDWWIHDPTNGMAKKLRSLTECRVDQKPNVFGHRYRYYYPCVIICTSYIVTCRSFVLSLSVLHYLDRNAYLKFKKYLFLSVQNKNNVQAKAVPKYVPIYLFIKSISLWSWFLFLAWNSSNLLFIDVVILPR